MSSLVLTAQFFLFSFLVVSVSICRVVLGATGYHQLVVCLEVKKLRPIRFIASICRPNKLGLLDLAKALEYYGQVSDMERDHLVLENLVHLIRVVDKARRSGGTGLCVIWDNSLQSLLAALIARLLGVKTAYYYHEPGGIGQKLLKSDPVFYSLKAALGEWLFKKATHFHIVARADKIGFGDAFCPLLFDDRRPEHNSESKPLIGFLGARRNQRLYNLFKSLTPNLREAGYDIAFFPSAEHGQSAEEKFSFLSQCTAVWNVYGVPYNQSGVTGDCIMSGTPVIHSAFEPYRSLLRELNLGVEVDLMRPQPDLARQIVEQLKSLGGVHKGAPRLSIVDAQSFFGGLMAFRQYWQPFFDTINNGNGRAS